MSNDELAALSEWEGSALFDERDRAVLEFSDALSMTPEQWTEQTDATA